MRILDVFRLDLTLSAGLLLLAKSIEKQTELTSMIVGCQPEAT